MSEWVNPDGTVDAAPGVLIVDDEEPMVELLAYVVADAGWTPLTAAHGRDALAIVRERWPALLITDLMMPYVGGGDLIAALRAEAETTGRPRVPAILVTGAGRGPALAVGADVVLAKPFELADLDALLRRFLGPAPTDTAVPKSSPAG
jgi:two-component system chemotaxis response regulator CheY